MSDVREALVALLHNEGDGGIWEHFDRKNSEAVADAILAKFDVTPRGKGTTIEIGGRRAGKTQALAERVADEMMKRGGSATVTSLPSVEDLTRAMHAEVCCPCDPTGCDVQDVPEARYARAVLALLPGRTEAEVKAEALREAADAVLHNTADPAYVGDSSEYARGYRQGLRDATRALRRKAKQGDERCASCGCELAYPTAVHLLDCRLTEKGQGDE